MHKYGVDYNYLWMRLGLAWYARQNYRQAIAHFEKAIKFNELDQTAMEYLYYAYLYRDRQVDIRRLMSKLNKRTREKLGIRESAILDEINLAADPGIAENQKPEDEWNRPLPYDTIYNSTNFYGNYIHFHGGASYNFHPNISIYWGYGNLKSPFTQKIRYLDRPLEDFTYTTRQNEYYGNFVIGLAEGIQITPAYHFNWYNHNNNNRSASYDSVSQSRITDTSNFKRNDYVVSFAIKKDLPLCPIEVMLLS